MIIRNYFGDFILLTVKVVKVIFTKIPQNDWEFCKKMVLFSFNFLPPLLVFELWVTTKNFLKLFLLIFFF